jgi:hypothetical protein
VVGLFVHGNVISGSLNSGERIGQQSDCQLLKKDSVECS